MSEAFFQGKVGFAIGTGRCGTKFVHELMRRTKGVYSYHERHPLNDAFHRYCKWYGLSVDQRGFLSVKEEAIRGDLRNNRFSFESSAHLSLSIEELYDYFGAKFLFLVRSPQSVVSSYYQKGLYETPVLRDKPALAPGLQEANPLPSSLWQAWGRIVPTDEIGSRWSDLTQVGRLAWFWNALNQKVINTLENIPRSHFMIMKLEELSYGQYQNVMSFFRLDSNLTRAEFSAIAESRPNRIRKRKSTVQWTSKEVGEFEYYVKPMASFFDYQRSVPSQAAVKIPPETLEKSPSSSALSDVTRRLKNTYYEFIISEFRKRFYRI
jgi:hypothetical protein